jgi:membrane-associated protease RseP (regulator of RpoE activity)
VPFAATLLVILGCHEFSHYLMSRRHGVQATLPLFIPAPTIAGTFGAVIRITSPIPDRRALLEIGVAGPLGGFVAAVPLALAGLSLSRVGTAPAAGGAFELGDSLGFALLQRLALGPVPADAQVYLHPMAFAAWIGLFVTALNLLPIGQLDGGHVLYAAAGRRQAAVSRAVVLLLAPLGFLWWGWFLWGGMALLLGIAHPPVVREDRPLGRGGRGLALAALALLALTFAPAPFRF